MSEARTISDDAHHIAENVVDQNRCRPRISGILQQFVEYAADRGVGQPADQPFL